MKEITIVDKVYPGDYILYTNMHGEKVGYGVFVKYLENKNFPLTKRKMLLKNTKSNKYWSINIINYLIYFKEHVPPNNDSKMNDIIKIILSL